LPFIRIFRATASVATSTIATVSFSSIAADSHLPSGER
jgi:hypothetical protein